MRAAERMEAMGFAICLPAMSGAEPWTLQMVCSMPKNTGADQTYGSPMTKLSPAFTEGTRPKEPTSAAAASLLQIQPDDLLKHTANSRDNVSVEVRCDHDVVDLWFPEQAR